MQPLLTVRPRSGFTQVSEILPHAAAEVGGMLPPDIQKFTTFVAGVHSNDSQPAQALIGFLKPVEAAVIIKAEGLIGSFNVYRG